MDVVLLWGPERAIPEPDRLRVLVPRASDEDITDALRHAHKVLSEAIKLAPATKSSQMSVRHAVKQLREERPWLTANQANQAISQAQYFHWRDTGE